MPLLESTSVDHISFVVPILDEAVNFMVDYLGFEILSQDGPIQFDDDRLTRIYAIPSHAVGRFAMLQHGDQKIELVEWVNWGEPINPLRESTISGCHITLEVPDLDEAIQTLKMVHRMRFLEQHPDGFVYCFTPFGFQLKLVKKKSGGWWS
jgi:catechol 2,3-dioxygenase-like lactoylglutathione lyase family enzyme